MTSRLEANAPQPVPRPARASLTLAELVDAFMAGYAGPDRGLVGRLKFWTSGLGDRRAAEITVDDVADALGELAQGRGRTYLGRDPQTGERRFKTRAHRERSGATVNRYAASLGGVYRWARRRRLLPRGFASPTRGLERMPAATIRVRYLAPDERARLLAAARTAPWSRMLAFVTMLLETGCRRGEALGLRWMDVDLEARRAYVRASKNGSPHVLVLTPAVAAELARIRSRAPEDYVFASDRHPGRAMRVEGAWRALCAAARVENFRLHDCRHDFASRLAVSGASLVALAEALNHRQLSVVRRYSHLSVADREQLVGRVFGGEQ